jgi:queuine tRNA-ribosyltransferase
MAFSFTPTKKDKKTRARTGIINTPHGEILSPAFSVVGTRASVRGLDPQDLINCKTQVVLANAYHLYLEPGIATVEKFGGFASFMKWKGPTITDSGGYQVSFLWAKNQQPITNNQLHITDKGVYFRSHIDGSKHLLSPEKSIDVQRILGADIVMALDQPMGYRFSDKENSVAYDRTFKWAERSFAAWDKTKGIGEYGNYQALFGIIQGHLDKNMRRKSLEFILSMGFPGIAIGGEAIGSDSKITARLLDTISNLLPDNKPLHALGLGGGPEGILEAVERGVDIFDNSSITRLARTGILFVYPEDGGTSVNKFRIDIKKGLYKNDTKPVSKKCNCSSCSNFSRAYLRHLFVCKEILGARLATIHNVHFINSLMTDIRVAIGNNDFISLKKHWLG